MRLFRMHLKTSTEYRERLINYCLKSDKVLAIGWSGLQERTSIDSFIKRIGGNGVVPKTFFGLQLNDLVWTRDLDGIYYLCRITGRPELKCIEELDIGAVVPVEVLKVGTQVPGVIVSRFSQRGATIQPIVGNDAMEMYAKEIYNSLTDTEYRYENKKESYGDLLEFLPPLDLEELIIDYIQIKYNYYLVKNSVAKNDTTVKVECEFMPRSVGEEKPAVVQVKGGNKELPSEDFLSYVREGKKVFLFFSNQKYGNAYEGIEFIKKEDVYKFVRDYFDVLPQCIKVWAKDRI